MGDNSCGSRTGSKTLRRNVTSGLNKGGARNTWPMPPSSTGSSSAKSATAPS
ncbi:UNVERIFIED_ORG: hypothetical protein ABIB52_003879 [Arthrobacter sp. UYCu721]